MPQEFNQLYARLEPKLLELDIKRKELFRKGFRSGIIIGIVLFIIAGIILFFTDSITDLYIWFWIVAGIGIVIYLTVYEQSHELSKSYRQEIVSTLINEVHPGATLHHAKGISLDYFRASGLYRKPDSYSSKNLITGRVDATDFFFAEIDAEQVTHQSDGKKHYKTIFKGFFFVADFHKNFNHRTVLIRSDLPKFFSSEKHIVLESPEFEKHFKTYSSDELEARYILSPSLMNRLVEIDKKFPGKVKVSFLNSNVIVAIPNKADHFRVSIFRSVCNPKLIRHEFETISQLIGLVEILNLNTRIWSKQ